MVPNIANQVQTEALQTTPPFEVIFAIPIPDGIQVMGENPSLIPAMTTLNAVVAAQDDLEVMGITVVGTPEILFNSDSTSSDDSAPVGTIAGSTVGGTLLILLVAGVIIIAVLV